MWISMSDGLPNAMTLFQSLCCNRSKENLALHKGVASVGIATLFSHLNAVDNGNSCTVRCCTNWTRSSKFSGRRNILYNNCKVQKQRIFRSKHYLLRNCCTTEDDELSERIEMKQRIACRELIPHLRKVMTTAVNPSPNELIYGVTVIAKTNRPNAASWRVVLMFQKSSCGNRTSSDVESPISRLSWKSCPIDHPFPKTSTVFLGENPPPSNSTRLPIFYWLQRSRTFFK